MRVHMRVQWCQTFDFANETRDSTLCSESFHSEEIDGPILYHSIRGPYVDVRAEGSSGSWHDRFVSSSLAPSIT